MNMVRFKKQHFKAIHGVSTIKHTDIVDALKIGKLSFKRYVSPRSSDSRLNFRLLSGPPLGRTNGAHAEVYRFFEIILCIPMDWDD
jgi:hypothetical protein